MQNNQPQENKFVTFFKEKGYYIVLALCAVAVGISGYVFVNTAVRQNRAVKEEHLSVPITVTEPEKQQEKPTVPASSEVTTEASAETAQTEDADEAVRQAAAQIVVRPVPGDVLSPYAMDHLSYNETTRDWRVHNGVDLYAMPGQLVQAAKAGTVSAVYEDEYYGTTVILSHDGGYTTTYSNLTAMPTVEAGQTVAAGDIIGAVGSTALLESALESHLHFAVSCGGTAVDPMAFLS